MERPHRLEIDERVRDAAASCANPLLRSLDAIHLAASEVLIGARLAAFVTYDRRLLAIAREMALPVASPGAIPA